MQNINDIIELAKEEYTRASSNYPPFNSAHEGYAVLLEEVEELKVEVFKSPKNRDYDLMRKEAIQVVAMGLRFLIDVKPKENSIEVL